MASLKYGAVADGTIVFERREARVREKQPA